MTYNPRAAAQLRQRHAALRWWAEQSFRHPGGLVYVSTLPRMLGCGPTRARNLIKEGRFTLIEGMPGGNAVDRWVPYVELLDAPFMGNTGRPGLFGPLERFSEDYRNHGERKDLG